MMFVSHRIWYLFLFSLERPFFFGFLRWEASEQSIGQECTSGRLSWQDIVQHK